MPEQANGAVTSSAPISGNVVAPSGRVLPSISVATPTSPVAPPCSTFDNSEDTSDRCKSESLTKGAAFDDE